MPFSLCQISSVARSRSTLSELVVNFSPLCVPDTTTKQKIVVLSAVFYLDEFHKSRFVISFHIYTVSTRTEVTFRMYIRRRFRKVEYPYFISQIRFGPRKGTAEGGDPFGSLTKCRDHVSVVPEPMENWNELTLHVSSKYIFNQQYLAHHLFRYLISTVYIPSTYLRSVH